MDSIDIIYPNMDLTCQRVEKGKFRKFDADIIINEHKFCINLTLKNN